MSSRPERSGRNSVRWCKRESLTARIGGEAWGREGISTTSSTLFEDPITKQMHVEAQGPAYGDVVEHVRLDHPETGRRRRGRAQMTTVLPAGTRIEDVLANRETDGGSGEKWSLLALPAPRTS